MDNAEFARLMSNSFEQHIKELLDKTIFERLEQAEQVCKQRGHGFGFGLSDEKLRESENQFDHLGLFMEKLRRELKAQNDAEKPDAEKKEMLKELEDNFKHFVNREMPRISGYIAEYLLLSQYLLPRPNEYNDLTAEGERELYQHSGLDTPKKRFSVLLEVLKPCISQTVKRGGDQTDGFWTAFRLRQLLAYYNRFSIVIENAQRELIKTKRIREKKRYDEVAEKFAIPPDLLAEIDSYTSGADKKEFALRWAANKIGNREAASSHLEKLLTKAKGVQMQDVRGITFYDPAEFNKPKQLQKKDKRILIAIVSDGYSIIEVSMHNHKSIVEILCYDAAPEICSASKLLKSKNDKQI